MKMYPFIELFGLKISMNALGIVLWIATFLLVTYSLCKKNHQDFLKLFYQIPWWVLVCFILWSYVGYALTNGVLIPASWSEFWTIFIPKNNNVHFVGLLLAAVICISIFFSSIKRVENKKIWADILFLGISSACIVLGIFFVLGDTFIGKPTESFLWVQALSQESNLTKFNGVYPVGLFLSFWALIVHFIFNSIRIFFKKNGCGLLGFIFLLIVLNVCFFFQAYPRYGVFSIGWGIIDIKQYVSLFVMILILCCYIKWGRNKF